MKIMMSENKPGETMETPAYVVTAAPAEPPRKGRQMKYIVLSVAAVLIVGFIIGGIVLGVHFFTQAQKEIVKFSFQFKGSQNNDIKQEVESDPNDNVVMYHLTQPGQDAYIVNDFNRGLQIIKIAVEDGQTNCFVTPLNVSDATDPSKIIDSQSMKGQDNLKGSSMPFLIHSTPVADRSFLTKKAVDMCSGISLYWAQRKCLGSDVIPANDTAGIAKRAIYHLSPQYRMGGLGGCCDAFWACYVEMTEYIDGNYHICDTYVQTTWCCYTNQYYSPPIAEPYCRNIYYAYWNTPGLQC